MFATARMKKLRMIVLKRDAEAAAEALGELGAVQLTKSREEVDFPLAQEEASEELARCRELLSRVEMLLARLRISPPADQVTGEPHAFSLAEAEEMIVRWESAVSPAAERLTQLATALQQTGEQVEALESYRELKVPFKQLEASSFFYFVAGTVEASRLEGFLAALPAPGVAVTMGAPQESPQGSAVRPLLIATSRKGRWALETALQETGFQPQRMPEDLDVAPAEIHAELVRRLGQLQGEHEQVERQLGGLALRLGPEVQETYRILLRKAALYEAGENFADTWSTVLITGWVPSSQCDAVREAVLQATQGRAVVETEEATREDIEQGRVPSQTVLWPFLRPFERLVSGYGAPLYQEIEPTLLFAASFLLMFGVIFGDLGHGICLLGIGLLACRRGRKALTRDMGHVIAWAGLTSALFGTFFQGTAFGKPLRDIGFRWTLGFEPIRLSGGGSTAAQAVIRYIIVALILGCVLISLGVILNIINRLRVKDYYGTFLGRFGVVGIVFYWGSLGLAVKAAVFGRHSVDVWLVAGLVLLPLCVLLLREPIYALLTHRKALWLGSPVSGLFEGLVEAGEAVMTYLANTFSFLRVAAFALSHAGLCFTIFVLSGLVGRLPGGPVWSSLVFVFGTALIIGLEGLIVAIQIIRLEYYEFFTKFFRAEGTKFRPFRFGGES